MIKSRRMRWTGHVARTGRRGCIYDIGGENQKERDHQEYEDVSRRTILKWI
jgi:hypothetical protein